jgi:hypothetical protein
VGSGPGPALAAWLKWAAVPDPGAPLTAAGLRALTDHLEQALPSLAGELRSLSADAGLREARDGRQGLPARAENDADETVVTLPHKSYWTTSASSSRRTNPVLYCWAGCRTSTSGAPRSANQR